MQTAIGGNFVRVGVIAVKQAGRNNIVVDVKGDFTFGNGDGFETGQRSHGVQAIIDFDGRMHRGIGFISEDVLRAANARAKQADETDAAADFEDAISR